MKYKVGDKVAVLATVDCLYQGYEEPYGVKRCEDFYCWLDESDLINPLSERNRTKAYQMHYKRVKGERDDARTNAIKWKSRFDALFKKLDQQKEREEALRGRIAKEQEDYANLAGKYSKVIQENCTIVCDLEKWKRKEKAWKISWFILLVTLVITSTINLIGVL